MNRRLGLIAAAILVSAVPAWRMIPRRLCSGFLPPNNLKIMVDSQEAKGLSHEQFDQVLDRIQAVYGPIVAAHGGTLQIDRRWDDATVNASATREFSRWTIHMYGGLARYDGVTQDGFMMVACHELGHHLGGTPKAGILIGRWASNEGEADYYANLKCARIMFADPGTASFTRLEKIDPIAENKCAELFKIPQNSRNPLDQKFCMRGTMAGLSLATLLQALGNGKTPLHLDTPDPKVVWRTDNSHPAAQCRLDTYFQGSLCLKSIQEEVGDRDPADGTCTLSHGYMFGMRPLCWYKPPASEPMPKRLAPLELVGVNRAISVLEQSDTWKGQ